MCEFFFHFQRFFSGIWPLTLLTSTAVKPGWKNIGPVGKHQPVGDFWVQGCHPWWVSPWVSKVEQHSILPPNMDSTDRFESLSIVSLMLGQIFLDVSPAVVCGVFSTSGRDSSWCSISAWLVLTACRRVDMLMFERSLHDNDKDHFHSLFLYTMIPDLANENLHSIQSRTSRQSWDGLLCTLPPSMDRFDLSHSWKVSSSTDLATGGMHQPHAPVDCWCQCQGLHHNQFCWPELHLWPHDAVIVELVKLVKYCCVWLHVVETSWAMFAVLSGKAWLHTTDVCCLISKVRTTQCVRRYNLEIFFAKKENMSLWVWSMQARCFILWSRAMSFWFRFCWDRLYLVDLVSKQDRARRLKARQGSSAQGASNTNFPASSLQLPRVFLYLKIPRMINI